MTTDRTLAAARISSIRAPEGIAVNDEIRRMFPAVFTDTPSPELTSRYQFYPSHQLITDMSDHGMKLVSLGQQHSTKRAPEHQMHVMRFQPDGKQMKALKVGDSQLELIVLNSHNGRNRFQAHAGIFRLVCLNGMVIADQDLGGVRTKHFGANNSYEVIQELVAKLADRTSIMGEKLEGWRERILDAGQQARFARTVMDVRAFPSWLEPTQLLEARRVSEEIGPDGKRDLWTTFNVIQENVVKGEIDKTGAGRPSATRPVTGAYADVSINVALWERLEAFSEELDKPNKKAKPDPVDEPEVQAKKDAVAPATTDETPEERKRRQKRESAARARAKAKLAAGT